MNKKLTKIMGVVLLLCLGIFTMTTQAFASSSPFIISNSNGGELKIYGSGMLEFRDDGGEYVLSTDDFGPTQELYFSDGEFLSTTYSGPTHVIISNSNGYELKIYGSRMLEFRYEGGDYNLKTVDSGPYQELYFEGDNILMIEIFDDQRPAISGQENFVTNVDDPKDLEFFLSHISAIDDVDGDISHKIVVENDNYTKNKNTIGAYIVDLSVEDSSGNRSEFTFIVNVVDTLAPVINGDVTTANISYDKTWDYEAFRNTLEVTDNYDSMTKSDIKYVESLDTYTPNKTKLGTYKVVYEATDSSGNVGTFTKTIKVIDGVKPVFQGVKTIEKSYTKIMTIEDIIDEITVTDHIDGPLTDKIVIESDTYTGNANKVGVYEIVLSATDKAGNKATHTITVTVIDDKSPDWYITNGVTVNLTKDATLTREQIIDLLTRTGQVQASANSVVYYETDTYTENIGEVGIYLLKFKVNEPNGNSNGYEYAINVMSEDDNDTSVVPKEPSIIDKTKDFFREHKKPIIIGAVVIIGGLFVIGKIKDEAARKKRRKRRR